MSKPTPSSTRILLISDDEHEKELTSFMLSCGGFDTQIALNAQSALSLAEKYRYPVVVLDMGSSKLDFLDIAERLGRILDFHSHSLVAINAPERSDLRDKLVELQCRFFIESDAIGNLCNIIQNRLGEDRRS